MGGLGSSNDLTRHGRGYRRRVVFDAVSAWRVLLDITPLTLFIIHFLLSRSLEWRWHMYTPSSSGCRFSRTLAVGSAEREGAVGGSLCMCTV